VTLRTPAALRASVERLALDAGADAIAVASAEPDETTEARLRASFARGDLATWGYDDARAARATRPAELLAGARSVVCVAVAYATPAPAGRRAPRTGRTSNYAWSPDYHRTLRPMLRAIADGLDALAGEPATAIACDTAPLAERALAAASGLGWVGKHTNVIAGGLGSFVFLGEVVTTLAIPPDAPRRTHCGSCRRCVSACPTGALRGDYTIDATRCISDLTQRRGPVPRELRPLLGDWVWGCDLCQDACPPTRRAGAAGGAAFAPALEAFARPDLIALLRLRARDFGRGYARTAMGWRGGALLRRNAALALGNALDRAAAAALARSLEDDPHPVVRGAVAWALGRIGSPRALAALRARARIEPDPEVAEEITVALAAWPGNPRHAESGCGESTCAVL